MKINPNSIRFRLVLWYSGLITVVSVLFGAAVYRDVELRLNKNTETTLSRRANQLGAELLPQWNPGNPQYLADNIKAVYSPEATSRFIRVTDKHGAIIYVSGRPEDGSFDPLKIPLPPVSDGTRIEPLADGIGLLIVAVPQKLADESVTVEVGALTSETAAVLVNLLTSLALGLPLVALIVSAGGYVLVQRALRPVERLRAKAQEITFGNLEARLPVAQTGDEIEDLAVTLNQMLMRLSDAYHQASRFSADASHELRTPLAIIRAELESLARNNTALPAPTRAGVESVLEEIERMSRITESLFALSRLDAGEAKAQEVRVDFAFLVRNTVDQIKLLADEKQIALTVAADEIVYVRGDPARLKQVVVDLIDNALKYTPAGGKIALRVFADATEARLDVSDTGIGIPADAIPHVFERFYRADSARSRQIDGSGIGLAIVSSICQAHGGSVDIESVEGAGTTCHVHIPLAA